MAQVASDGIAIDSLGWSLVTGVGVGVAPALAFVLACFFVLLLPPFGS